MRGREEAELTDRWRQVRLGDVLALRKEVIHPHDHPKGRAAFVGLEHVESLTGLRRGCAEVEMAELTGRKPRFYRGDIVYGYLRPYLNKVWIAEFDGLCSVDQYVYAVDASIACAEYLAWFMRSPVYLERAPITTTPGQLPRIRTDEVASVGLALPPVAEQQRIAAILTGQMAAVERARAAAAAQLKAARALPAAYLRSVFEGKEARHWSERRLGEVCTITARQVDPRGPQFGALPHVSGENIASGLCRLVGVHTAAEDGMTSAKYLFRTGDVLYSKLRPYLRKAVVAPCEGVCSADIYPIHVDETAADSEFLCWLLVSASFTKYADEESRRARMPKLNRDQLFAYAAPLPPVARQRALAVALLHELTAAARMCAALEAQLDTISKLPAAALRQAFSGKP